MFSEDWRFCILCKKHIPDERTESALYCSLKCQKRSAANKEAMKRRAAKQKVDFGLTDNK